MNKHRRESYQASSQPLLTMAVKRLDEAYIERSGDLSPLPSLALCLLPLTIATGLKTLRIAEGVAKCV